MYHEESDTPAMARTSNLNEELGQVIVTALFHILLMTTEQSIGVYFAYMV